MSMSMNFKKGDMNMVEINSCQTVNPQQAKEIVEKLGPTEEAHFCNSTRLGEYLVIWDSLGEGRKWIYIVR